MEAERYTSPADFQKERDVLFRWLPIVVGRTSDLPEPSSFFTHDDAGVPILVTRDPAGRIHAMVNLCRHRGMRLVEDERGTADTFVCPLHAWTYDLCGNLGQVAGPSCLHTSERSESALVELPCEVRHGFIWVIPRPSRKAATDAATNALVAPYLGRLDDELAAFGLGDHVAFARNVSVRSGSWKVVMEAFCDDAVADAHSWKTSAPTSVFYTLFPNSVLAMHRVFGSHLVSHLAVFPTAVDEVLFIHTILAPREPRSEEERASWQKAGELAISEQLEAQRSPSRAFHDAIDRTLAQWKR